MTDTNENARLMNPGELPKAYEMFDKIFRSAIAVDAPFLPRMRHRALGFPFWQHDLTHDQWQGFARSLERIGLVSKCVYMRAFGGPSISTDIWMVTVGSEYPYPGMIRQGWHGVFESCIFSPEGDWGLAVSDNEFAVAASLDERYVSALGLEMREFTEAALVDCLDYWNERLSEVRHGTAIWAWLPRQLRHIYGEMRGVQLAASLGILGDGDGASTG